MWAVSDGESGGSLAGIKVGKDGEELVDYIWLVSRVPSFYLAHVGFHSHNTFQEERSDA